MNLEVSRIELLKRQLMGTARITQGDVMEGTTDMVDMDETIYEKNLPAGLNMKLVEELSDYNSDFVVAALECLGELATLALCEDDTRQVINIDLQITKTNAIRGGIVYDRGGEIDGDFSMHVSLETFAQTTPTIRKFSVSYF